MKPKAFAPVAGFLGIVSSISMLNGGESETVKNIKTSKTSVNTSGVKSETIKTIQNSNETVPENKEPDVEKSISSSGKESSVVDTSELTTPVNGVSQTSPEGQPTVVPVTKDPTSKSEPIDGVKTQISVPVSQVKPQNKVEVSRSSGLGNVEEGNWKKPSKPVVPENSYNGSDFQAQCTAIYFVENVKWKERGELESFQKRTKLEKLEDLFTHRKVESKWKREALSWNSFCSQRKSTLYIWVGLGSQLDKMAISPNEDFQK